MATFVPLDSPTSSSPISYLSSSAKKERKGKRSNKTHDDVNASISMHDDYYDHDRVEEEVTRPSSQRQRILRALMTDDMVRNSEEGAKAPSPPMAPASSSSSSPRLFGEYSDNVATSQEIPLALNVHPEELVMRFSENTLEPKDDNRENTASIREMDQAISSLRMWQQKRQEHMKNHSVPPLPIPEAVDGRFPNTNCTRSGDGGTEFGSQCNDSELSMPLSARLADDDKIASIRKLIDGSSKQQHETSVDVLRNLELQKKRVQEVESDLMDSAGDIDVAVADLEARNLIRIKALELEQQWNTDGLELMDTTAEGLKASLEKFNAEVEKYL